MDAHPTPNVDEESLDLLCGDWKIFQLRKGHRFSTDDVVCAVVAVERARGAPTHLDLGAGTGSVGLFVLLQRPPGSPLVMVEAQDVSVGLARKTVTYNQLGGRVTIRHRDLRDPGALPESERGTYALVTGTPPYIPVGNGIMSPHPQRAACRMELRGDVFDYCRVAAQALAPDGWFCLVHSSVDPRPEAALAAAGLTIRSRRDVRFRRGRPPTISVWAAGWGGERVDGPDIVIREDDGRYSAQYEAMRRTVWAPELRRAPREGAG